MIFVLILLSILFFGLAFILNEKNAKKLLAGYNTMSKEDQQKIDLKKYIPFFRKFHIFLGISYLLFGLLLFRMLNENVGGIFLAVYPLLAYMFFISRSQRYYHGVNKKLNRLGIFILFLSLLFVSYLLTNGMRESQLSIESGNYWIKGSYGELIKPEEIESVYLVDNVPPIKRRMNGYALGEIRKGWFKTEDGDRVKLIINSNQTPVILITKRNGEKIYFSAKKQNNKDIFREMEN